MGWFSQIFNEEDRYKVHNSTVDLIDRIENIYSTSLTRKERLNIFSTYLIFHKKESFYSFDRESIDVVNEVKNIADDMIENLLTKILHVKNDKFNNQRYTLELGDSLNLSANILMPHFISAKVDNPNISEGQILRESIENILSRTRKRPYLQKVNYDHLFPSDGKLKRNTNFGFFYKTQELPIN